MWFTILMSVSLSLICSTGRNGRLTLSATQGSAQHPPGRRGRASPAAPRGCFETSSDAVLQAAGRPY